MVENENTEHSSLSSFYSSQEKSKRKSEINIGEKSALTLLKVISEILADICDQSNQSKEDKLIMKIFMTKKRPNISIYEFLQRLYKYSNVSEEILILLFIYIDRLSHNRKIRLNYFNIYKLILASFIAAIKYNSDDFYSLEYYAKFGGVSQKEIEALEYQFITLLDFRLYVEEKLYDKYNKYLRKLELDDDDDCDYNSDG